MTDTIYQIHNLQIADNQLSAAITYHADHEIFKGHFPSHPIVPGVCTMWLIKDLLQQATHKKLQLQDAGNVKFLQMILPEANPIATIKWTQADDGKINATAELRQNDDVLFKMNASYIQ